jgi:hypothetical protein
VGGSVLRRAGMTAGDDRQCSAIREGQEERRI